MGWAWTFDLGLGLVNMCKCCLSLVSHSQPSLIRPDTASDNPQLKPELQNPSQFFNWTESKVLLLVDFCNSIE